MRPSRVEAGIVTCNNASAWMFGHLVLTCSHRLFVTARHHHTYATRQITTYRADRDVQIDVAGISKRQPTYGIALQQQTNLPPRFRCSTTHGLMSCPQSCRRSGGNPARAKIRVAPGSRRSWLERGLRAVPGRNRGWMGGERGATCTSEEIAFLQRARERAEKTFPASETDRWKPCWLE